MKVDPVPAAAAVVVHQGRVLLVRRRNPPDAELWGYPGGHVEPGETEAEAATRELREETGVEADAAEVLIRLDVGESRRFRLAMVSCIYRGGEPAAHDDAMAAEWMSIGRVLANELPMSRDVGRVLRLALAAC